ncbi:DUF2933 domain-containing protein [Deinococcus cellulosilyticus]|uniref:DUF2933 domain-containing protein n=1 Tax=Deinococcus cellulosilyticus (strain DSM 18568 / NBRC 106333 / KACC 11606 / 5516J-15) TaxID=1223518 RepID=A0A511N2E2_DEIC1|nr:DUF2933 domain-containing protein [Deinococcus cellulosilyticus]GEM46677.1 hypothetical protein DC3_23120 [Deinococcus cellulosilyticus NBRC 106333 = KACC 11606]
MQHEHPHKEAPTATKPWYTQTGWQVTLVVALFLTPYLIYSHFGHLREALPFLFLLLCPLLHLFMHGGHGGHGSHGGPTPPK